MSIENIIESVLEVFIAELKETVPEIAEVLSLANVSDAVDSTVATACDIFDRYVTQLENQPSNDDTE